MECGGAIDEGAAAGVGVGVDEEELNFGVEGVECGEEFVGFRGCVGEYGGGVESD